MAMDTSHPGASIDPFLNNCGVPYYGDPVGLITRSSIPLYLVAVAFLCVGLRVVSDEYFAVSIEGMIQMWGIPHNVAGATFMAIGASTPELMASFVGVFIASESATGSGTVIGSIIFNHLLILGCCILVSPGQQMQMTFIEFSRDLFFYGLAIALFIWFFIDAQVTAAESWGLFGCYIAYVIMCIVWYKVEPWLFRLVGDPRGKKGNHDSNATANDVNAVDVTRLPSLDGVINPVHPPSAATLVQGAWPETPVRTNQLRTLHKPYFKTYYRIKSGFETARSRFLSSMRSFPGSSRSLPDDVNSTTKNPTEGVSILPSTEPAEKVLNISEQEPITNFNNSLFPSRSHKKIFPHDHEETCVAPDMNGMHGINGMQQLQDSPPLPIETGRNLSMVKEREAIDEEAPPSPQGIHDETHGVGHGDGHGHDDHGLDDRVWRNPYQELVHVFGKESWVRRAYFITELPWVVLVWITGGYLRQHKHWVPLFFIMLGWLVFQCVYLTYWLEKCACTIGITPGAMGTILGAAGTSIPNLLCSMYVAKKGHGVMACTEVWGSNVWLVFVCLGLPWGIHSTITGKPVKVANSLSLSAWLGAVYAFYMIQSWWTKWHYNKWLGYFYCICYAGFVAFVFANESLHFAGSTA